MAAFVLFVAEAQVADTQAGPEHDGAGASWPQIRPRVQQSPYGPTHQRG